jgi:hypothetical protein
MHQNIGNVYLQIRKIYINVSLALGKKCDAVSEYQIREMFPT